MGQARTPGGGPSGAEPGGTQPRGTQPGGTQPGGPQPGGTQPRGAGVDFRSTAGRWIIAATVLGSGIAALDATVVGIALPTIGKDFGSGVSSLQWVVTSYMLTLAGLLLLGGALGDRYGRRKVFTIGVVWFAASSLLCGIAPNPSVLIAARALQGVGGALLTPGSLAILQASFVEKDRPRAIGAWSGLGGVATAIGPFLGGFLIGAVSWRLVFFINLPIAVAVGIMAARHVPETSDPTATGRLDYQGAALITIGLSGVTYGLIESPSLGWASLQSVLCLGIGGACIAGFVFTERHRLQPMLPLGVFRSLQFSGANVVTFVVYGALGGALFLLPIQLQQVSGYSPIEAGSSLLPVTVMMLALSSRSGAMAARIGPRLQMSVGPIVVAAGLVLMTRHQPVGGLLDPGAPSRPGTRVRPRGYRRPSHVHRPRRRACRACRGGIGGQQRRGSGSGARRRCGTSSLGGHHRSKLPPSGSVLIGLPGGHGRGRRRSSIGGSAGAVHHSKPPQGATRAARATQAPRARPLRAGGPTAQARTGAGLRNTLCREGSPESSRKRVPMAYNVGRTAHDADAHIMEPPTWLRDHADPDLREKIRPLTLSSGNELRQTGDPERQLADLDATFERLRRKHASDDYRQSEADEIMNRKNFAATGSFIAKDRPRALDLLGFSSQLVFNTFHNRRLRDWEHSGDVALAYGTARAHNRGMVEFCSVDPRLLPTCYVPLVDFSLAVAMAEEAIDMGAAALLVASGCPPGHSQSHVDLDQVWARAEEAGIPVVFHVGGTGDLIDPNHFLNGLPVPADFHGGEENFRSVDYMGIPWPPAQALATMIFDGVLERFPTLRFGVIEQGAIWVPSWERQMESAFEAFERHEERLRKLSLRPSEYVRRQVRFTPYPTEDVGWIIEQSGPDVCMFSSDYPHVEGGRHPIGRFEASLGEADESTRSSFYCNNFLDLMGSAAGVLQPA